MTQENQPLGPLTAEFCQWDHGASIVVCHKEREIVARIEPTNEGDNPVMENAEHEPWDAAYATLFAASPDLKEALEGVLGAIAFSGWSIDDERWTGPMRAARLALEKASKVDPRFAYPRPSIKVRCPSCGGDDALCLYCEGEGEVSAKSAEEWHRQNDEEAQEVL